MSNPNTEVNESAFLNQMNSWYGWLLHYIPEAIKKPVQKAYEKVKEVFFPQAEPEAEENILSEDLEFEILPVRRLGNDTISHYSVPNNSPQGTSPLDFLSNVGPAVVSFIQDRPQNKIQLHLVCNMMRIHPATGVITTEANVSFNSQQESIFNSTDVNVMYKKASAKILESFAIFSRWMLKNIVGLNIFVSRLRPLRGSSYISLPIGLDSVRELGFKGSKYLFITL